MSPPRRKERCPNDVDHTPHPSSYLNHHEWAEGMMKRGYVQERCPGCGLWAIWVKKKKPTDEDPG